MKKLLALVQTRATVLRDGRPVDVPTEQLVTRDVVLLRAGDVIRGDGRVLDQTYLFVAEASLTGETFPVEKAAGLVPPTPCLRCERTDSSWAPASSAVLLDSLLSARAPIRYSAAFPSHSGCSRRRPVGARDRQFGDALGQARSRAVFDMADRLRV